MVTCYFCNLFSKKINFKRISTIDTIRIIAQWNEYNPIILLILYKLKFNKPHIFEFSNWNALIKLSYNLSTSELSETI